jgi:hypothetical protein
MLYKESSSTLLLMPVSFQGQAYYNAFARISFQWTSLALAPPFNFESAITSYVDYFMNEEKIFAAFFRK